MVIKVIQEIRYSTEELKW